MNKITFLGVYSKMAEKRIFLIFVDSDLNLCKASQVRAFRLVREHLCTDLYENLVDGQVLSYEDKFEIS